jgi:hypothetical protein
MFLEEKPLKRNIRRSKAKKVEGEDLHDELGKDNKKRI